MLKKLLSLLIFSCFAFCCACSSPPEPPEPTGEKVSINPPDFPDKYENFL